MEVIEYEFPESWDDRGMDWNAPDPRRADYVMAIRQALMERAAAAHVTLPSEVVAISPWKTVSLKNRTTTLATEYARQGKNWKTELTQFEKERRFLAELGIEE